LALSFGMRPVGFKPFCNGGGDCVIVDPLLREPVDRALARRVRGG
jgi:hypothetical protein